MLIARRMISRIAGILSLVFVLSAAGPALAAPHTVVQGDTLWKISQSYGIPVTDLVNANALTNLMIYPGQVLQVPGTKAQASYTVQAGDTLTSIGQRHSVTPANLINSNGLANTMINPGQILVIPRIHVVRPGDTLWIISQSYGMTVADLMIANNLSGTMIEPGNSLIVSAPKPGTRVNLTAQEYDLFVRMIAAEAGNEPYRGMVAVGAVILNRVRSRQFPNTVREVLYQPKQFEPVQNGWLFRAPVTAAHRRAADEALSGVDPTNGALYFFAHAKVTNRWLWARPHLITIGGHRFTA